MNNCCTLIAVSDMDRSKQFYHDLLGLEVAADFGANVTLTGGIALQTVDSWTRLIQKDIRDQGVSPDQIARRMDVPEDYVAHCLALLDRGQ